MASGPYETAVPLHRSRSNHYKPPPLPTTLPAQSYESRLYMDEKNDFIPPVPNVPPPPSFQDASTVSMPADMFDRMFLHAQTQEAAATAKPKPADPTPLAIVGFLLSLSPLSCDLMGWRGAGGNGAASVGAYFFLGGLLMLISGLLFYHQNATFPFVVFASFGGFWLSYGATLVPFFNAFGAYSPDLDVPSAGLATQGFNASFGFYMVFMAVLCLVYLICSVRTNAVFVVIFAGLMGGFVLLTVTFWLLADGIGATALKTLSMAGTVFGVSCLAGWYLLLSLLLASVDFPIALPLGDLSGLIKGASDRAKGL